MTKIIKWLWIEWYLNDILSWLYNQDEYWKLFKVGKIEIEKLLELHKTRIIEEIVKNYENRNLYKIWAESLEVKNLKSDESKLYIKWYNDAVAEINKRTENFSKYLETVLQNII